MRFDRATMRLGSAMTAKTKTSDPLFLMPMPLDPQEQKQQALFLAEQLKERSLDEIAEQQLNAMYSRSLSAHAPRHRFYRNLCLVYSRAELKGQLLASYRQLITPSIIKSVFPSNGVKIEEQVCTSIIVYLADRTTELNLERCSASIDGRLLGGAILKQNRVVFAVKDRLRRGVHCLRVTLGDSAGNESDHQSEFEIIASAESRDQYWRKKQIALRERLASDKDFRKLLFADARAALTQAGVPLTRAVTSILLPPFSEQHASFFANLDLATAPGILAGLQGRISAALEDRDNERIARVLWSQGAEDPIREDGGLARRTKNTISKMFQDPHAMMADLGITALDDEKKVIPPPFSKETADAFADWISTLLVGAPPETSPAKRQRLGEIAKQVKNDPDLLYKWLTNPKQTFQSLYPDATAREMLALPAPRSEEEAKQIAFPSPAPAETPPETNPHNSSDLVIGFSLRILNKGVYYHFSTLNPGLLPLNIAGTNSTTGLPFPFDTLKYALTVAMPDNLSVVDPASRLLSLSDSGSATVTSSDNTAYSFGVALTPFYSILLKDEKIFLKFVSIDVVVSSAGLGISDPIAAAAIETFIEDTVRARYPTGEIYLGEQRPFDINLPFADTAVDLHHIHIIDDQDPEKSGELFFGISVDGTEYLFGRFDADSGSDIQLGVFDSDRDSTVGALGRQYRLNVGTRAFDVGVRGIDRDLGAEPDLDDFMGEAVNRHLRAQPGRYALLMSAPIVIFELVWAIVGTILEVICFFVDVIIAIINKCLKILGYEHKIEWRCQSVATNLMEWVRRAFTVGYAPSAVLEYSVSALNEYSVSAVVNEYHLTSQALYLSFDLLIPKIADRSVKTTADDFVKGPADFGIAISENLLDKVARSWWKYSTGPRTFGTQFDDRWAYAHLDLDHPTVWLSRDVVNTSIDITGSAGLWLGSINIELGLPSRAYAENSVILERDPQHPERYQLRLRPDKVTSSGAPAGEQWLINLITNLGYNWVSPEKKFNVLVNLYEDLRFSHQGSDFRLNPLSLKITEDEILASLTLPVSPVIRVEPPSIVFTLQTAVSVKISNDGNIALAVSAISTTDGSMFVLTLPRPVPFFIQPKDSISFTVGVDPMWAGDHSETLTIESNDLLHPVYTIPLTARDVPIIRAADVGFGKYDEGFDIESVEFEALLQIENIGHAALQISTLSIDGDGGAFSFDEDSFDLSDLPLTIPSNGSKKITLRCTTESNQNLYTQLFYGNSQGGVLTIESNDPDRPVHRVRLNLTLPSDPWGGDAPGTGDEMWYERHHPELRQRIEEADWDGRGTS